MCAYHWRQWCSTAQTRSKPISSASTACSTQSCRTSNSALRELSTIWASKIIENFTGVSLRSGCRSGPKRILADRGPRGQGARGAGPLLALGREVAAVDDELRPGDVARLVGEQEAHDAAHLLGCAEALEHDAPLEEAWRQVRHGGREH